jgi:hypothetical protein
MTDLSEQLEIRLADARLQSEKSSALPAKMYGDPARIVMLQSEQNCSPCVYSRPGAKGEFCGQGREYGKRCSKFKDKRKRK